MEIVGLRALLSIGVSRLLAATILASLREGRCPELLRNTDKFGRSVPDRIGELQLNAVTSFERVLEAGCCDSKMQSSDRFCII
jgi:hypothetical protein